MFAEIKYTVERFILDGDARNKGIGWYPLPNIKWIGETEREYQKNVIQDKEKLLRNQQKPVNYC